MAQNKSNKHIMYDFEKIAMLIALVITIAIVLLVVFATRDSGRPSPSAGSDVADASAVSGESEDGNALASAVIPEREIEFTTIKVENTALNEGALILVNQQHEYKKNIDDKLTNLYSFNGDQENWYGLVNVSQKLRKEVIESLNEMYKDYYAALEKADVVITKTYVSAEEQQAEYDAKVDTADPSDKPYMQSGGYSEHQTGYSFNLRNEDQSWFNDNCYKYGFVLRYPEGKESVTYVKDESNHYRYVGVPHAVYMKLNKLVLEEYLGLLETKTYNSRLKLDDGTSDRYETYAVKASTGGETELKVPNEASGWGYMISGTNNGYYVVTIYKIEG